jgi:uncharacterized protein with HEPN domain
MSPRHWEFRIQDIKQAIADIETFVAGISKEQFIKDKKAQYAVIRAFEIIGEAAFNIPNEVQLKYPKIEWRLMKDMRNKLSHEYFGIDVHILWETIHKNLPSVKRELEAL